MVRQINVFMENKIGRLYEICNLLGENGINIRGFSLADMADFGLLRLIVDKTDLAKEILKKADFPVSESKVIVVSVPDVPGGLARVLKTFTDSDLSVEYTYIVANTKVAFSVDNLEKAESVLSSAGFEILSENEL
ncbi:MAG: ACT domain-containing protein [Actinobacteria bacterium]|nr:ACT domain-containing protein [Actinomycetota bacterium]